MFGAAWLNGLDENLSRAALKEVERRRAQWPDWIVTMYKPKRGPVIWLTSCQDYVRVCYCC